MSHKPHLGRWLLASSVAAALIVSPFALASGEGNPVKGGKRNPSSNASVAYQSETEIIASNGTYGTRQSNKGDGGGAIYGCRSAPGAEPCVRASNLEKGRAFEFNTGGAEAGQITAAGGDNAKPFTTNATGVATGLNADRVDSKSASEISGDAVSAVRQTIRVAAVNADGTLAGGRGVASASTGTAGDGTYQVVFSEDISACAFQATETTTTNAGAAAVSIGGDKKTVTVVTRAGGGADGTGATDPADRPFHLVANCI
jgi:hypothetical protein